MKKPFQRVAALALSAVLAVSCCGGALAAEAEDTSAEQAVDTYAEEAADTPIKIAFPFDAYQHFAIENPTMEQMKTKLPTEVTVTLIDDEETTVTIDVTWVQLTEEEDVYLASPNGPDYGFKMVIPDGYTTKNSYPWEIPHVYFTVCAEDKGVAEILDYRTEDPKINSDLNTIDEITAEFNAAYPTCKVMLKNGQEAVLNVTWTVDEVYLDDYFAGESRALGLTMNFPDGYRNVGDLDWPFGWVFVSHKYDPDAAAGKDNTTETPDTGDNTDRPASDNTTTTPSEDTMKTTVSTVTTVPETVAEQYPTVEAVHEALVKAAQTANTALTADNTNSVLLDVTLEIKNADGTVTKVTPENFPKEGVEAVLPYPEGTDASYTFVITHMITSGDRAGEIETLTGTNKEDGIHVLFTSMSPVCISYQKTAAADKNETTATTPTTTPTTAAKPNATSPKTADESPVLLTAAALAGSCALLLVLMAKKKKA